MFEVDGPAPIRIATCHFERAESFWHRALGLVSRPRGLNRVDLVDGDGCTRLLIRRAPPPHRQHPRIMITVHDAADVPAAAQRLIALGASYPESHHLSHRGCAVLYDPDGNTIEIHTRASRRVIGGNPG
ncbi:VOC family protein [Gordonia sp. HY285]|uniref:VOC family protein n=1 Tax=Gordonia liuliyuniae TaxID=2911517 RepID=UPI001F178550|nr:VOC family protein [Gordonia liuliyuniae]MCF8610524.1 VOC family protein [Gordonia liuliyuniae]